MATLTICPELLLSILTYLDNTSLAALAVTSKVFLPYINPLLYHTADWGLCGSQCWPPFKPPLDWLRTLSSRPDLVALVKHLILTSTIDHLDHITFDSSDIPRKVIKLPKVLNLEVLEIDYYNITNWSFEVSGCEGQVWSGFGRLKEVYFRNTVDVEAMEYYPDFEQLLAVFFCPEPGDDRDRLART